MHDHLVLCTIENAYSPSSSLYENLILHFRDIWQVSTWIFAIFITCIKICWKRQKFDFYINYERNNFFKYPHFYSAHWSDRFFDDWSLSCVSAWEKLTCYGDFFSWLETFIYKYVRYDMLIHNMILNMLLKWRLLTICRLCRMLNSYPWIMKKESSKTRNHDQLRFPGKKVRSTALHHLYMFLWFEYFQANRDPSRSKNLAFFQHGIFPLILAIWHMLFKISIIR